MALNNNQLTRYTADAPPQQRLLETPHELRSVLRETFGLTLAGTPDVDALLARLTAPRQA